MAERPDRIDWIDNARGIGIVLVVIGHVATVPWVVRWIFLFHMPLFFALSGAVARPMAPGEYMRRRWATLAVPYLCWLALIGLADAALAPLDGARPVFAGLGAAAIARRLAVGGTELGGAYGVFWFVPCLFAAGLVHDALAARGRRTLAVAAIAGALLSYALPWHRDPLGLLAVPMALFFLWLGARTLDGGAPGLLGLAAAAIAFLAAGMIAAPFDMKYLRFGVLPVNLAAAAAGVLLVAGIARWSAGVPRLSPGLTTLGRASPVVMYAHQLVHYHLERLLPEPAVIVAAVAIPLLLWRLFMRTAATRRLLLGIVQRPLRSGEPMRI